MGDILIVVLLIAVVIFIVRGVRIVQQSEKGVIETLGKYTRTVDSGLTILIPILQNIKKVDMREQVMDVPPQEVITKDNVLVRVDAIIYHISQHWHGLTSSSENLSLKFLFVLAYILHLY